MALEYEDITQFEALAPILEDYADWFANIAMLVAYAEEAKPSHKIIMPLSFSGWLENVDETLGLSQAVISDIQRTHDDMVNMGDKILEGLREGQKPSFKNFQIFKESYSAFISRLRRLEKDSALESSGLDEATGLRNAKNIEGDTDKELERLARQGSPFSLVLTRIDRFAGQPDQQKALDLATNAMKECMRPFDDVYYIGNGVFLISLKQADILGAEAAVGRLQLCLQESQEKLEINPKQVMTMSYCITEPAPEDKVIELMANMQNDLTEVLNDSNIVLKFVEISPLERFIKSK